MTTAELCYYKAGHAPKDKKDLLQFVQWRRKIFSEAEVGGQQLVPGQQSSFQESARFLQFGTRYPSRSGEQQLVHISSQTCQIASFSHESVAA